MPPPARFVAPCTRAGTGLCLALSLSDSPTVDDSHPECRLFFPPFPPRGCRATRDMSPCRTSAASSAARCRSGLPGAPGCRRSTPGCAGAPVTCSATVSSWWITAPTTAASEVDGPKCLSCQERHWRHVCHASMPVINDIISVLTWRDQTVAGLHGNLCMDANWMHVSYMPHHDHNRACPPPCTAECQARGSGRTTPVTRSYIRGDLDRAAAKIAASATGRACQRGAGLRPRPRRLPRGPRRHRRRQRGCRVPRR